jgi:aspartate 1-decarboxylase
MNYNLCRAKIHKATVTSGNVNYSGSITICKDLLKAAGILPYELVHVNNVNSAAHWETYVIPGPKGEIILNGSPARLFQPGDPIVIMVFSEYTRLELEDFVHTTLLVNEQNQVTEVILNQMI